MTPEPRHMIELFKGSGRMAAAFRALGWETLTIDNNPRLKPDLCLDILRMTPEDIPLQFLKPQVVWASPPCTAFSVAAISKNWRNRWPISEKARLGIALLRKTESLIMSWHPEIFFIENPRGMMRHLHPIGRRVTQTFCQWGERYQKPTDIFTNSAWIGRRNCHPGDSCHERQPRNHKARKEFNLIYGGVQGLSNAYERGKLPIALCQDIAEFCSGAIRQKSLSQYIEPKPET